MCCGLRASKSALLPAVVRGGYVPARVLCLQFPRLPPYDGSRLQAAMEVIAGVSDRFDTDTNSDYETPCPVSSTSTGAAAPFDRAAQRRSAPQTDPHLGSRWIRENHAPQCVGGR